MSRHARGGHDHIVAQGGPDGTTFVYGDAGRNMTDHTKGGSDILDGSKADFVVICGDAGGNMSGYAKGGNDLILGGANGSTIFRDAGGNMSDHSSEGTTL